MFPAFKDERAVNFDVRRRFTAQTHLSPEVMEVSVCSRFFIDSLLCLSRPEAPELGVSGSTLPRHRAPVSRLESTRLPAHLRSRAAASSFFIRDILAERRTCSLLGQAGQPDPQPDRLQSGLGKDHQNKSPSSESEGKKPTKIKAVKQLGILI